MRLRCVIGSPLDAVAPSGAHITSPKEQFTLCISPVGRKIKAKGLLRVKCWAEDVGSGSPVRATAASSLSSVATTRGFLASTHAALLCDREVYDFQSGGWMFVRKVYDSLFGTIKHSKRQSRITALPFIIWTARSAVQSWVKGEALVGCRGSAPDVLLVPLRPFAPYSSSDKSFANT